MAVDTGRDSNSGTSSGTNSRTVLARPPSTRTHERDTLLAASAGVDDCVIRQSPHVRKRAASAFKIDF